MLTLSQFSFTLRRAIQSASSATGPALTLKNQYSSAEAGWGESTMGCQNGRVTPTSFRPA
ncbi:MAG: hypothetical protein HW378_3044 [Anaerolineales bacterium]|nr:hypothetical protein [Anaerolineales bacterium]